MRSAGSLGNGHIALLHEHFVFVFLSLFLFHFLSIALYLPLCLIWEVKYLTWNSGDDRSHNLNGWTTKLYSMSKYRGCFAYIILCDRVCYVMLFVVVSMSPLSANCKSRPFENRFEII